MIQCPYYVGICCCDGHCPAIEDETYSCEICPFYRGCEDCAWNNDKDYPCEYQPISL